MAQAMRVSMLKYAAPWLWEENSPSPRPFQRDTFQQLIKNLVERNSRAVEKLQRNEYSNSAENEAPFLKRFYKYQKERFPFLAHGLLIASFSFSAIAYSRICRNAPGFIELKNYLAGIA